MPAKKYIRHNIYRWHRVTGLIVALPILLWSVSGFLHPFMNSFKPVVKNQFLPAAAIDTNNIHIKLRTALQQNNISVFHNFRIVKLDGNYYYQIQRRNSDTLTYLSCIDGKSLKNGDQLYASYLAQRFLCEPIAPGKTTQSHSHEMNADVSALTADFRSTKTFPKTKVLTIELVKEFKNEYKSSNVLLPVYGVRFDRADGIRLYIETSTDRLATAVDNKKAWFINFFAAAHTWSFLDGTGPVKNILLAIVSLLCFVTSVFGFILYNIINKKKASSSVKTWHRSLGNIFVLTTALYGISGAWHAIHKLSEKIPNEAVADRTQFSTNEINFSLNELAKQCTSNEKLTNVSVVKIDGEHYWQLFIAKGREKYKRYLNTKTLAELPDGDIRYGSWLACNFSGRPVHSITQKKCLNEFTSRYSMMNKRLPVIEVTFAEGDHYYVETATGRLSTVTNSFDEAERFSFSNLHMHHYWETWFGAGGKTIQKTVLISSTFCLLLLAITGAGIYCNKRFKRLK